MNGESVALSALILFAFLCAGTVKGVIGMGLPSVVMAVLGLVMLPLQAAALLVLPSLVTNFWQAVSGPALRALSRRFASMLIGVFVGTPVGFWMFANLPAAWGSGMLGAALALYGILGLVAFHPKCSRAVEPMCSPLIGLVTGLLSGATGVFVIPAVPYLNSLDLNRDELVQTLGMSFIVSTVSMAIGLWMLGRLNGGVALQSALAVLPALIGMMLGRRIRHRLSAENFKRVFFAGMLLLGGYMVLRALL
jgi:uncharacterized protein